MGRNHTRLSYLSTGAAAVVAAGTGVVVVVDSIAVAAGPDAAAVGRAGDTGEQGPRYRTFQFSDSAKPGRSR